MGPPLAMPGVPAPDPGATIERTEPARPLTDVVRDTFGDGTAADVIQFVVEPALQLLAVLGLAIVASRLARRLVAHAVWQMRRPGRGQPSDRAARSRRATRAEALGSVLSSVANVAIVSFAGFTVLGVFGINVAPLIAGAGVVGLAIGFGAKNLVADFIAGVFMLAEDQYGRGDVIDAGDGIVGEVEAVTLRTTRLRDLNGTLWHIPNGEVRRTGNMSQGWSRAVLDVSVAYNSDVDHAASVILDTAREMGRSDEHRGDVLADPDVWGVETLGADAVVLRLAVVTRPGRQWAVARDLRRRIRSALATNQIEIPFPQRTLWVRESASGDSR